MDRINKLGKTLLGYKSELLKHYSAIVDDSLLLALDSQMDKKLLTLEDYNLIIDDNISVDFFEKHLLNKKEYIKSAKELMLEFEKIREIVNNGLIKIGFIDFIETESNIDSNKISILRQYTITDEFIKIFFGIEDKEMELIMRKKGFAEKFAVLRLTKIFKEIYSEMRTDIDYTQGFSKVYYNNEYNGFSIDYKYNLNVDNITDENIELKLKKIKETDKFVERKFTKKTSMQYYNIKPVEPLNNDLTVQKNNPINKTKETEIKTEEINTIKNQTKNIEILDKKEEKTQTIIEHKDTEIKDNAVEISNVVTKEITKEDFFDLADNLIENSDSTFSEEDFIGELPENDIENNINEANNLESSMFSKIPSSLDDEEDLI